MPELISIRAGDGHRAMCNHVLTDDGHEAAAVTLPVEVHGTHVRVRSGSMRSLRCRVMRNGAALVDPEMPLHEVMIILPGCLVVRRTVMSSARFCAVPKITIK